MDKKLLAIAALGIGGVALYFITRPKDVSAVAPTDYTTTPTGQYQYPVQLASGATVYTTKPEEAMKWTFISKVMESLPSWLGGRQSTIEAAVTTPIITSPSIPVPPTDWDKILYPYLWSEEPAITIREETPYGLSFM